MEQDQKYEPLETKLKNSVYSHPNNQDLMFELSADRQKNQLQKEPILHESVAFSSASPKKKRSISFSESMKHEAEIVKHRLSSERGWPNAYCILITMLLVIIGAGIAVLVYFYGPTVVTFLYDKLFSFFEYMHEFKEPYRSMIFFATSYLLQIFGAPIASVLITLISFCSESIWIGFLISYPVSLCSNTTLYFVFRKTESTYEVFDETVLGDDERMTFVDFLGKLMKDFIEQYPYRFGLALRTLHLPDYAKMYILIKYNTSFYQMIVPCIIVEALNVLMYSFIGSQLKSKFDFINPKSFNEKPFGERMVSVLVIALVVLQVVIFIAGFIYTKKKYQAYEQTGQVLVTPRISRPSLNYHQGDDKNPFQENQP